jgi:hypothetical protein
MAMAAASSSPMLARTAICAPMPFAIAEVFLEERSRLLCDVASNGMF